MGSRVGVSRREVDVVGLHAQTIEDPRSLGRGVQAADFYPFLPEGVLAAYAHERQAGGLVWKAYEPSSGRWLCSATAGRKAPKC